MSEQPGASPQPSAGTPVSPARPTRSQVRADAARASGYRSRFALVYVALAVVAGIGVGAFLVAVVTAGDNTPASTTKSSSAEPSQPGEIGAMEIARQVQKNYRLASGDPLVNVVASRNTLQDGQLGYIRVRYQLIRPGDARDEGDSKLEVLDNAIQYSLCGIGANCTIPGTATAERGQLVRRLGLELALRTFRNDPKVQNVTVFLRPIEAPAGTDGYVLVFRRSALAQAEPDLTSKSVEAILPGAGTVLKPGELSPDQGRKVEELTNPHLYVGVYQLLGGRDAMLQLQPVS